MILTALDEYYRQLLRERPGSVPELGWALCKVTHLLALSPEGELVNVIPAPDKKGWTKRVPEREKRTVGIAANALCDNSSYLLGIDAKGSPRGRVLPCGASSSAGTRGRRRKTSSCKGRGTLFSPGEISPLS